MRFKTIEDFSTLHFKLSAKLLEYADAPRSNYVRIDGNARQAIDPRHAYRLSAASPSARTQFARVIDQTWDASAEAMPRPFHLVTFVSPRFAFAEDEAHTFDLAEHHNEITGLLGHHSFIAMTEAAYYPRWRIAPGGEVGPIVSWHTHAVTMGASRSDLEADLEVAKHEQSIIPNVPAVDIGALGWMRVKSSLLYSVKMPHRQYTPYARNAPAERVDRHTGELVVRTHNQSKADLRPGQLAKMVNLMKDRYLDDLMFGNGVGAELAAAIKTKARRFLDRER